MTGENTRDFRMRMKLGGAAFVCPGCHNKIPQAGLCKQQTFTYGGSGGWHWGQGDGGICSGEGCREGWPSSLEFVFLWREHCRPYWTGQSNSVKHLLVFACKLPTLTGVGVVLLQVRGVWVWVLRLAKRAHLGSVLPTFPASFRG